MKRRAAAAFLVLALALHADAQQRSDRERDGLIGPVRSVRTETAALQKEAGEWVERERQLVSANTYDEDGKRTQTKGGLPPPPAPLPGAVPSAQAGGDGNPSAGKTTYTHDPQGRLIEEATYDANGSFRRVVNYEYDAQGNVTVVRETRYKPDLSPEAKLSSMYEYDEFGNWIKETKSVWSAKDRKQSVKATYRVITYY